MTFEEGSETRETLSSLHREALEAVSTHGRSAVQVMPLLMADVLVSWGWLDERAQEATDVRSRTRRQMLLHDSDKKVNDTARGASAVVT